MFLWRLHYFGASIWSCLSDSGELEGWKAARGVAEAYESRSHALHQSYEPKSTPTSAFACDTLQTSKRQSRGDLDHLLASRVFRRGKVTGRYDATIDDLNAIEQALTTVWKGWKSEPRRSMALLADDRRRKERGA